MDEKEYWNGTIPFVSAASMHETYIDNTNQKISESGLINGSKLLKQGNLLLLVRGSMLWKAIPVCYNNRDVAFNQDVKGLILNENVVNQFLLYWLKSKEPHIKYMVTGTGLGAGKLDTNDLQQFPIYTSGKDEQLKIAHLFARLDERIATQNKIIERYESLIRGINQYVFTNTGINYKLGELCEIRSGYSGNQLSLKNGLKVSRIETISGHKVNMERVGYVAPFESSENYRLQIGDILFSNINSVEYIGNTAFIDKDYGLYHGMNLLRLIPNKEVVMPSYLYLVLNTNRLLNHFKTVCNKAVSQASINQTELGKTIVRIPDLISQKKTCELFQTLYTKLEAEKYYISLLQNQKQHLLCQMFI